MNFVFFTLGGKQLWEDLFFCQGWRIQRNVITGRHRLLDEWDIRRESGSMAECQSAFVKYAEAFQITKPNSRAVVFIHGFGRSKDMFKAMDARFEASGYTAISINFPTLYRPFDNMVEQLGNILKNLKGIKEINFVAYGFGGLVLRKSLTKSWNIQNKMRIGRIVIINTPNRGALWGEKAAYSPLWLKILGQSVMIYTPDFIDQLPDFPLNTDTGAITSWNPFGRGLCRFLPKSWRNLFQNPRDNSTLNTKETIVVKSPHLNPCNDEKVILPCINFIKSGKFASLQKIKKL